jgi:hypothetical protein
LSVGSFDDLDFGLGQDVFQNLLEFRSLITAVGIKLQQEREHPEQRGEQHRAAVAILNVGGGHDGVQHETLSIHQDAPLLALDLLFGVKAVRIDRSAAFFRALHALSVDNRCGRAGLPRRLLATIDIERVMHLFQRAVAGPSDKRPVDRAPGRQVLGNGAPLTTAAEDAHDRIRHLTNIHRALVAARFGWRNQRRHLAPLRLAQIALVAQMAAVVAASVLSAPHPASTKSRKQDEIGALSITSSVGPLADSNDSICFRTDI